MQVLSSDWMDIEWTDQHEATGSNLLIHVNIAPNQLDSHKHMQIMSEIDGLEWTDWSTYYLITKQDLSVSTA